MSKHIISLNGSPRPKGNTADRTARIWRIRSKKAVLLMAAEGNGLEESVYWYERLMKHLGIHACQEHSNISFL